MDASAVKDLLGLVETAITIIAILVGGFWTYMLFVKGRQKFPKARLKQKLFEKVISDDARLLHVSLTIENVGEVLLELKSAEIRVEQIDPLQRELKKQISSGQDLVKEGEHEIV